MNNRTHINTRKSAIFAKKNLKINMLQIKNIIKLRTTVIIQENVEVLHIVYVSIVYLVQIYILQITIH